MVHPVFREVTLNIKKGVIMEAVVYAGTCELVNTYEILEHIMGMDGLHPHSLTTINMLHKKLADHAVGKKGVVVDIGCGSSHGTYKLSRLLPDDVSVIGVDVNPHAINKARANYSDHSNMEFYLGSLEQFCKEHPDLNVIGIISVSVSMFMPNTKSFYHTVYEMLADGGMFIDAPFVFKDAKTTTLCETFKKKTYEVCGCNMKMNTTNELYGFMQETNFKEIKTCENEFELMNMNILFHDYSPVKLISSFIKNIFVPPSSLDANSTSYLFRRTLEIFSFFMKNRNKYGASEVVGIK
jgi:SAM-dependent methyltransferase